MNRAILRCSAVFALLVATGISAFAQDSSKHPITFADMIGMHRVASNIWIVATAGGAEMQLTRSGHDSSPVWSPDAKTLAFLSSRSGVSQVYLLSMEGGEAHPLTKLSTGADIVKWSPDGKSIAFTSSVYPDCKDDDCN